MIRIARYLAVAVLLVAVGVTAQPAWATLPTPNQPILVVQDSSSADPYQNFVPELLTTEGLNGFQTAQLADLTAAFLTNYDVVILPHLTLTSAQATLFSNYVNTGGTLIGFRPGLQLASVFGVASLGTTLSEGWLKIDTGTAYGAGLDSSVMKFHGVADLYSLSGASALATLYNSATLPTSSPAASIYTFGSGKAILFSFDLTQSNVLMRQGNPAWAGYPNNHDGYNTMRASQMFMDQGSGRFWNDLGDGALNDVPQADIQLRLFSNALVLSNSAKRPLPKLWYFPSQNRALLLLTGDHHGDAVSDSVSEIGAVQSSGGKFSEFLWYPFGAISNTQVNTWLAAGHAMGVHFDDTAEVDSSGVGGSAASWSGMQNVINTALASFATTYPSAPTPITTRDHFLIWVSRNAAGTADQTAQAKLFQNAGIQLDTSYSSFPNRWGYMTGSGLPMKFLDATTGTIIPVYEQATQYEDDIQLGIGGYSLGWDVGTAQSHYQQSLSDSLTKYNTVVTMLFHPDHWSEYSNYAQTVLQYSQANSIPMYTTAAWLQFWNSRVATAVSKPSFASNTLTFTATGAPAGLTLLVPDASGTNKVASTFTVDGVSQSFTVATYQGIRYASVVLTAGAHNVSVTYVAAGRILGQISPVAAAASTTIQVQNALTTATVSVAADGTYVIGPFPAGTYTVTPLSSGYAFSPSSRSVTLAASDVTGINFTASSNPAGQTLFTTQTPVVTNGSDGVGANYELGTSFTSTAAGQITGIRFWKATSETGTHTGRVWSSTGTLLASVTFAAETASGWQQQSLATPLPIAANTAYVVSVNTGNTFYVATNGGLSSQVANGNLRSVVGNNGLFGSTGLFPTNTWQGSNYFRDVVFVPGATYTISGTISPSASGSGATVTLSGAASATATADASGNYTFSGLVSGSYTVTPSKAGFTFSPTSAAATVNGANVTANFTITPIPTYSISGTITPTASGSGATLTLSGAASATATADASGNYTFTGLSNGSYVVTPSKTGFTFTPTNRAVTVNGANVTAISFTATAVPTYSISGTITPAASGSGATVTLSGTASATATADASGNYTFTGVNSGSYTVTPSKSGFTFAPVNAPVTVNTANVTAVNFTATANPVGQSVFTTQTPAGEYSDGPTGNYELGMAFTSNVAGQITGVRFWKASTESGTHTGKVWSSTGTLLASVTFAGETASGWQQQALTVPLSIAANTTYVVSVNTGNTFYVATNSGLASAVVNGNLSSVVGNNGLFGSTGTFPTNSWLNSNYFRDLVFVPGPTYSISGTVSPSANGSGATITLSGAASKTATADASGNYTFSGLANGSYTVTPSKAGFTFNPASAAATVNNGNVSAVNFTIAAVPTYSISGTISPSASGSGATVTLSGAAGATATADASGNYTFAGLVNGSYTVTPSKTGFTFNPTSAATTVNSANLTGVNFTATAVPTFSISGTISPSASGTGATVTLSGAASKTATADASGNYSFTGLVNGSYTVTPSKSGFVFAPLNLAVTINSANVGSVNFTATAAPITIDTTTFFDQTSPATTVTSAAFSTTSSNELLLAMVGSDVPTATGTNNSVLAMTGGGLTWVLVQRSNTQRGTAEIWRAFATAPLTNVTVTYDLAISAVSSITVMSFKGVNTTGSSGSGAIGSTGSTNSAAGAPSASLVTVGANSLVVGVGEDWTGSPTVTAGSSQTVVHQLSSLATFWSQRQNATTAVKGSTVTINDTAPTSAQYNLAICEILAGS